MLTATIENLCCFRIIRKTTDGSPPATDDVNLPFWITASDGICYGTPVQRDLMVTAGGERHDFLVQFPEPGEYPDLERSLRDDSVLRNRAKAAIAGDLYSFRTGGNGAGAYRPDDLYSRIPEHQDIKPSEIVRRRHMTFDLEGDTCRFPFSRNSRSMTATTGPTRAILTSKRERPKNGS